MRTRGQRQNYLALHDEGYGSEALSEDRISGGTSCSTLSSPTGRCRVSIWFHNARPVNQKWLFTGFQMVLESALQIPNKVTTRPEEVFSVLGRICAWNTRRCSMKGDTMRFLMLLGDIYKRTYLLLSRPIYAVVSLRIANNCEYSQSLTNNYSQSKIPANKYPHFYSQSQNLANMYSRRIFVTALYILRNRGNKGGCTGRAKLIQFQKSRYCGDVHNGL